MAIALTRHPFGHSRDYPNSSASSDGETDFDTEIFDTEPSVSTMKPDDDESFLTFFPCLFRIDNIGAEIVHQFIQTSGERRHLFYNFKDTLFYVAVVGVLNWSW